MAVIVMVYGASGSGKSTSLRNFKQGEISVINVTGKPYPFRAGFTSVKTDDYKQIRELLSKSTSPSLCVDDSTYLLVNEFMRTAKVNGFQKFTDMALNFWNLVQFCANELPENKIVYFIGQSEQSDNGTEKFRTIGKLIDEKVVLEGLFTVVLKTVVNDGRYFFSVHTNGQDTVKTPIGMYDGVNYVDNDLKAVDSVIREYYGLNA